MKIIIALFIIAYYIVTLLMCKGIKLKVKSQAIGGIVCAITLVLSMILGVICAFKFKNKVKRQINQQ